jgi:hypothetical protein
MPVLVDHHSVEIKHDYKSYGVLDGSNGFQRATCRPQIRDLGKKAGWCCDSPSPTELIECFSEPHSLPIPKILKGRTKVTTLGPKESEDRSNSEADGSCVFWR